METSCGIESQHQEPEFRVPSVVLVNSSTWAGRYALFCFVLYRCDEEKMSCVPHALLSARSCGLGVLQDACTV